jgi:ABC-type Mn2+/Zn2+ transport system permease subunit
MVAGMLVALAGFGLSYHYDMPLGDTVVATGCAVLGVARISRMLTGGKRA